MSTNNKDDVVTLPSGRKVKIIRSKHFTEQAVAAGRFPAHGGPQSVAPRFCSCIRERPIESDHGLPDYIERCRVCGGQIGLRPEDFTLAGITIPPKEITMGIDITERLLAAAKRADKDAAMAPIQSKEKYEREASMLHLAHEEIVRLRDWIAGAQAAEVISHPPREGGHTEEFFCAHRTRYMEAAFMNAGAYAEGADCVAMAVLVTKKRMRGDTP